MNGPLAQQAQLLGLLLEAKEDGVRLSGAALTGKLGWTRRQFLDRVEELRGLGYVVEAVRGAGYRLATLPDAVDAASMAPLLYGEPLGQAFRYSRELGSTNDEAHRLAEEGAPHGTVVLAEVQSSGRGRRGRAWMSPPGTSVTLSLVLRLDLPPARAAEVQLVAALAVCETARGLGVRKAAIKWPNDVEVEGRKLAGVLAELHLSGDRIGHLVLGIGLNVNLAPSELPAELRAVASSLWIESGAKVPRSLAVARLLRELDRWLSTLEEQGFEPVRRRWRELSSTPGRRVRVELGLGGETGSLEGQALELAEDGALLVRDDAGALHRIHAGDVHHLRST